MSAPKRNTQRLHWRARFLVLKSTELYQLARERFGEDDHRTNTAFQVVAWANELLGELDPAEPKASADV